MNLAVGKCFQLVLRQKFSSRLKKPAAEHSEVEDREIVISADQAWQPIETQVQFPLKHKTNAQRSGPERSAAVKIVRTSI